ncbi:MAG: glycosyltransferase [Chloroflexi bacterium]|nr:glycosyltransferase [Chloroflexota bacterium]
MKLVIFGLAISSSWGNGHATIWRGLLRALIERGHDIVFFERDVPYYAANRDLWALPGGELILYPTWEQALPVARYHLSDGDVAMVTSYCPDAVAASDLVLDSRAALKTFYDLDTGVTLERLRRGQPVSYLGPRGLADFDLVLSFTGGAALDEIKTRLGARRVAPLYGCVDPRVHHPAPASQAYGADMSYLGTYAEDRQDALNRLFIEPARRLPKRKFLMGGSLYPSSFPWAENIAMVHHVPPPEHAAFYCSSRLTLNVTRGAMAQMGYCPSARLFEAAACGVPILSDAWDGLSNFFEPDSEIIVARSTDDVLDALAMPRAPLAAVARRARDRALTEHTAERRAQQLEGVLESELSPLSVAPCLTTGY